MCVCAGGGGGGGGADEEMGKELPKTGPGEDRMLMQDFLNTDYDIYGMNFIFLRFIEVSSTLGHMQRE